jgi:hypothetical protein
MPLPNHCIDCDKVAVVFLDSVPYCSECALKRERFEEYTYRGPPLFKKESE